MEIDTKNLRTSLLQQNASFEDQDNNSEEEELRLRKSKIHYLNLGEEELKERLKTLKSYSMWKMTKAKRINIRQLNQDQQSPVINAALSFGDKNGKNQVLLQFIQEHDAFAKQNEQKQMNRFQKLLVANCHVTQKTVSKNPSFLSYKTHEQQKQKIYKMIRFSTKISQPNSHNKRRAKTQHQLPKHIQNEPYPRQLMKLKQKLSELPSIKRRSRTEVTLSNPEDEDGNGNSIHSQLLREHATHSIEDEVFGVDLPKSNLDSSMEKINMRQGRENYLQEVRSILNRSDMLLREESEPEEQKKINSLVNSVNVSLKNKSSLSGVGKINGGRCYWPNYDRYAVSQADQNKMRRMWARSQNIFSSTVNLKQQSAEMLHIVEKEMTQQQYKINGQVLQQQKNAFMAKFKHKIQLQRDNYKRNVKELLRCRKEYRIQKQRAEVRANGIKRIKRIGDDKKKNSQKLIKNQEQ